MDGINQRLLDVAAWRLQSEGPQKTAFVPAQGGDPAAAGGDPSAAGGDPSGGMPPGPPPGGDPMAGGGGAPPMDPMAGGMPPGGGGGGSPTDLISALMPAIQQAIQQAMAGGAGGAAGGPKVGGPGAGAKIDPGMIYMELGRVRKLLTGMYQNLQWDLPPDILDDQMVAQSVAGQQPVSPPTDAGAGAPPPPPGLPALGGSGAINPIQAPGGGATKQSSLLDILRMPEGHPAGMQQASFDEMNSRIDVIAALSRRLNK